MPLTKYLAKNSSAMVTFFNVVNSSVLLVYGLKSGKETRLFNITPSQGADRFRINLQIRMLNLSNSNLCQIHTDFASPGRGNHESVQWVVQWVGQ